MTPARINDARCVRRWSGVSLRRPLRRLLCSWTVLGACAFVEGGEIVEPPAPFLPALPTAEESVAPNELLHEIEGVESEKAARLRQLQEQLRQLQRVMEQRRSVEPVPAASQTTVPQPPEPNPPPVQGTTPTDAAESQPPSDPPPPLPMPDAPAPTELFPTPVVEGPIDRLALADSLFATQDIEFALQMYEQVDRPTVSPDDRLWIEYQIAGCHRRLGNIAEAEQRYRKLAGMTDGGWYASQSRWWLDALSARKALQADLLRVTTAIQTMEKQIHAAPMQ